MAKNINIDDWLRSAAGKNAMSIEKFNSELRAMNKDQIKLGREMHNLESELKHLQSAMLESGYALTNITTSGEGSEFVFEPINGRTDPDDYVSFNISRNNGGLLIHNGMVAYNSPVAVMNSADELGFVSSINLALSEATKEVEKRNKRINQMKNQKDKTALIKYAVRQGFNTATNDMSATFDSKGLKNLREYTEKAIRSKRPESTASQQNQLHYERAIIQMYKKAMDRNQLKFGTELQDFAKQFESTLSLARSVKDIGELEKALKMNWAANYNMLQIWDSQLKNFFKPIIKNITQGGITEGNLGRIGLTEPKLPFSVLASTGKKPTQNTQVWEQNTNFQKKIKTVAIGMNKMFTAEQKKLLDKSAKGDSTYKRKDLYGVAYVSEADIAGVFKDLEKQWNKGKGEGSFLELGKDANKHKRQVKLTKDLYNNLRLQALKGFGEDASFMSESMAQEFAKQKDERRFKNVNASIINNRIIESLKKGKYADLIAPYLDKFNYFELDKTLSKITDQNKAKQFKGYVGGLFKQAMQSYYGVDNLIGEKGFGYKYNRSKDLLTNITAYRNVDNHAFVSRAGGTGDYRTNQATMSDLLMELVLKRSGLDEDDYYDKEKKQLKVNLLRSNTRDYSHKTIQTDVKEVLNYISTKASKEQVADDPLLSKFITVDADGDWIVDESAVNKFFTEVDKETGKKQQSAAKFLYDLVERGKKLGVYKENKDYFRFIHFDDKGNIITDASKADKTVLASVGPRIGATENAISSTPTYSGMGDLTSSSASRSWRERASIENTYENFSQWLIEQKVSGKEYQQKLERFKKLVDHVRQQFVKNEQEVSKYLTNLEGISGTFNKDAEGYRKKVIEDELSIVLTAQDILGFDTSSDYNNPDESKAGWLLSSSDQPHIIHNLIAKAKDKYDKLTKAHGEQWLQDRGIKSFNDLMGNFHVDLGENNRILGNHYGQLLSTAIVALPRVTYDEDLLEQGVLRYGEGGMSANRIIATAQDAFGARAHESDSAFTNLFRVVTDTYDKYRDSVAKGGIYESLHKLRDDPSSGRLTTLGLNDFADNVFADIAGQYISDHKLKDQEADKIRKRLSKVNAIMSTRDYASMWATRLRGDERSQAEADIDKLFRERYSADEIKAMEDATNKKGVKTFSGSVWAKLRKIIDAYDISSKTFKAETIKDMAWNRDPTINFLRDVMGMTLVLSHDPNLIDQGNIMINKDLLAVGHGDMDGDLIAVYRAFQNNDEDALQKSLEGYFHSAQMVQNKVSEADERKKEAQRQKIAQYLGVEANQVRFGDVSRIDQVQNKENQALTVGSMWRAKKGSGIFGDLAFAGENLLRKTGIKGLNINNPQNAVAALGGKTLQAVFQSLYQNGINVKNATDLAKDLGQKNPDLTPGELTALVQSQSDSIFEMSTLASTFDDINQFRKFINKGQTLGIFGKDSDGAAMFEGNAITASLLPEFQKKSSLRKLKTFINKYKKNNLTGAASQEYRGLLDIDLANINEVLNDKTGTKHLENITSELATALVVQGLGDRNVFADKSLGEYLANRYMEKIVKDQMGKDVPLVNRTSGKFYDDVTAKMVSKFGEKNAQAVISHSALGRYLDIRGSQLADTFGRAPTTATNQLLYDDTRGTQSSSLSLAHEIIKAAAEGNIDKYYTNLNSGAGGVELTNLVGALLTGTISHAAAEALQKGQVDVDGNSLFTNSKEAQKYRKQLTTIFGKETAKQKFAEAVHRGEENYKYIEDYVASNGGRIIGSEMALAGFDGISNGKVRTTRQIADIMYKVGNKVIVGDYKNYAGGELKLENALQVMDYVESLKDLQMAARDIGSQSADLFLQHSENTVAAGWKKRLEDKYTNEDKYKDMDSSERKKLMEEEFTKIYDAINQGSDATEFGGEAVVQDTRSGMLRHYKIDTNNHQLRELLELMKSEDLSLDQLVAKHGIQAQVVMQNATQLIKTEFVGNDAQTKEQFKTEFETLLNAIDEVTKKRQEVIQQTAKIMELQNREQTEQTQAMLNKAQDRLAVLNDELKTLKVEESKAKDALGKKAVVVNGEKVFGLSERGLGENVAQYQESQDKLIEEFAGRVSRQATRDSLVRRLNARQELLESYYKTKAAKGFALTKEEQDRRNREFKEADKAKRENDREIKNLKKQLQNEEGQWIDPNTGKVLRGGALRKARKDYADLTAEQKADIKAQSIEKILKSNERDKREFREGYSKYRLQMLQLEKQRGDFQEKLAKGENLDEAEKTDLEDKVSALDVYIKELKEANPELQKYADILTKINKGEKVDTSGLSPEALRLLQSGENLAQAKFTLQNRTPRSSGGQGGSAGFLGIDAASTRWLSRLMNGGLVYSFIRVVRKGIHDITEKAKQLDQAMTNLRIVTGKSADNARTLIGQYAELGKQLGATTIEVTQAATSWLRQGYDIAQVNDLVAASMYLSKLGMIDTATATQNLKIKIRFTK